MDEEQYNYEEPYEYEVEEDKEDQFEIPDSYERGLSHQEHPFQIVPLGNIYDQLMSILVQIENLIYKNRGWCLILLKQFKWDKDFLKQSFYNNSQKYLRQIGYQENLQDPNDFDRGIVGICDVCCSEGIQLYYNICNHNYCLECWLGHLKISIHGSSSFPRCMDQSCQRPLLMQTVIGLLKLTGQQGKAWLNKYEKKLCEMFITTNRNYQFCTGIDCGNCIKINVHHIDTVTCVCGKVFCFKCQSDDHYPCKCQQKAKWAQQVLVEQADTKWICANAKICPSCKKAVQRSMGCNFMACTCGKNFCYMCSGPWQPDHKDHFKCHIYKKKPDEVINKQKEILQKMNHCTERYIFNQAVANNYKEIDVFAKRKYLFKSLKIQLTQSQFMESAYKFAIECCQKLKWIYAFTYFHELKPQFKEGFDFSLGEYERYKQNLLKLLAADLKIYINKIQAYEREKAITENVQKMFTQQFKVLKKNIVNYYTSTKNYKQKFVKQLVLITELMDKEQQDAEIKKYQQLYRGDLEVPMKTKKTKSKDDPAMNNSKIKSQK